MAEARGCGEGAGGCPGPFVRRRGRAPSASSPPGRGAGEGRAARASRGGRAGAAARLSLPARCHRLGKGAGSTGTQEFGIPRKERERRKEREEVERARAGQERRGLGESLGWNPGVQDASRGAREEAKLGGGTRTGRNGGNPRRLRELPAPSPEASSPQGDRRCYVYGQGEAGSPRSKPTGASGL